MAGLLLLERPASRGGRCRSRRRSAARTGSPGSARCSDGTVPGDLGEPRRPRSWSSDGAEPRHRGEQPLRVGMARPAEQIAPTGASSTLRPAYMTTTRCAISATTPRSCVISTIAAPIFCFSSRIRSRICAWIVTSSAVVGSSAISSFGLQASAIAIITRCRMPPESWCGYSRDAALGLGDVHEAQHLDRALRAPPCGRAPGAGSASRRSAGRSSAPG